MATKEFPKAIYSDKEVRNCLRCGTPLPSIGKGRGKHTGLCLECYRKAIMDPPRVCEDCGKPVSFYATVCRDCYHKRRAAKASHCVDCGKILPQPETTRCKACHLKFMSSQRGVEKMMKSRNHRLEPSRAELEARELLDRMDIRWIGHVAHGRWHVDLVLPDHNVAVEVNGSYYHRLEVNEARDARKKADLEEAGYRVLILWTDAKHLWSHQIQEMLAVTDATGAEEASNQIDDLPATPAGWS